MAVDFPTSPSNGQTFTSGTITYTYNATAGLWNSAASGGGGSSVTVSDTAPTSPSDGDMWYNSLSLKMFVYYNDGSSSQWVPASPQQAGVAGADGDAGAAGAAGSTQVVANLTALLATTGMSTGDISLVTATNKVYMYTGANWFVLAEITDGSPTAITGVDGSIILNTDGTATVITAVSTDPDGFPLTWTYTTSGLVSEATISQADNVFTITPSTTAGHIGVFTLNISVTDGTSTPATATSTIRLVFDNGGTLAHTYTKSTYGITNTLQTEIGFTAAITPDGSLTAVGIRDYEASNNGKVIIQNSATGAIVHTLDNPNPDTDGGADNFGQIVKMSNLYTMCGAGGEDNSGLGAVYVFNNSTGALVHTKYRTAALSGETAGDIGNHADDIAITDHYFMTVEPHFIGATGGVSHAYIRGRAYIWKISDGSLVVTHNANDFINAFATSTTTDSYFQVNRCEMWTDSESNGYYLINSGISGTGEVYMFRVSDNTKIATFSNPTSGASIGDNFGKGLAAHKDHLLIVAEGEDRNGSNAGAAFVYNTASPYGLKSTLLAPSVDRFSNQNLGENSTSCAINQSHVAIAAFDAEVDAGSGVGSGVDTGVVHYWKISDGSYVRTIENPNINTTSADDNFGNMAVGLSDSQVIIVGARYEDDAGATSTGAAYVFT